MEPYRNRILCGDAGEELKTLPEGIADCVVTSPPYFRQRDYEGSRCQVGLEETPSEYVERLAGIFRELRRVMRPSGTLWLVIGELIFDRARDFARLAEHQ